MESGRCWDTGSLAPFLTLGPRAWSAARDWLTLVLTESEYRDAVRPHLVPLADATLLMPVEIGDYVDFFASEHHATALGRLFRPDAEPLLPNWKHLPVGYHGRSGTVVVSGTEIVRPHGPTQTGGLGASGVRAECPAGHRSRGRVRRRNARRRWASPLRPRRSPTRSSASRW